MQRSLSNSPVLTTRGMEGTAQQGPSLDSPTAALLSGCGLLAERVECGCQLTGLGRERGQACSAKPPKPVRCELQSRRQRGKLSLPDWQRKDLSVWVLSVSGHLGACSFLGVAVESQTSPVPSWSALESAFPGSNLLRGKVLPAVTFVDTSLETLPTP